jgi:hypothetical protein
LVAPLAFDGVLAGSMRGVPGALPFGLLVGLPGGVAKLGVTR